MAGIDLLSTFTILLTTIDLVQSSDEGRLIADLKLRSSSELHLIIASSAATASPISSVRHWLVSPVMSCGAS